VKLEYPSFDGQKQARVAHGSDCVVVMIESPAYVLEAAVVMTAKEAAALGRRLIQQARVSLEPEFVAGSAGGMEP